MRVVAMAYVPDMKSHFSENVLEPTSPEDRRRMTVGTFALNRPAISVAVTLVIISALVQTGCLGLASNLMHAAGMDMVPAESARH